MPIPLAHIEADLRSAEFFGAVGELVSKLVHAGTFPPEAEPVLLSDIRKREDVMSTSIGFGIALPHASSRVVGKPVAAFGLSRQGIEYSSLDGVPVRFICLYVVPSGVPIGEQLQFLRWIGAAMERRKALLHCTTAPEIKAILDEFFVE